MGEKEFKIQRVNLLKNLNEFVLIERFNLVKTYSGNYQQTNEDQQYTAFLDNRLAFDEEPTEEDLYKTALNAPIIKETISVIQDYFDQNSQERLVDMALHNPSF